MSEKRRKIPESRSLKNCIDRIPYRVRLIILEFYRLFVVLQFKEDDKVKVEFGRSRYKGIQFNESRKKEFEVVETSKREVYAKAVSKCFFGYFKRDFTRKLFPIFRHVVVKGKYVSLDNLLSYLPKFKMFSLKIKNTRRSNEETKRKITVVNLYLGESNSRNLIDSLAMYASEWNMIRSEVIKSVQLGYIAKPVEEESMNLFKEMNLEEHKTTITKISLNGNRNVFEEILKQYRNLRNFRYTFDTPREQEEDLSDCGIDTNVMVLFVDGTITDALLLFISRSFNHLTRFSHSEFATSKVTGSGWRNFMEHVSPTLRYFSFSSNRTFVPTNLVDHCTGALFTKLFGHLEHKNVKELRYIRWNPPTHRGVVCGNGIFPILLCDLRFLSIVFPNLTTLELDVMNYEQAFFLRRNFPDLRRLILRRRSLILTGMMETDVREKVVSNISHLESERGLLAGLIKSNIDTLDIVLSKIEHLSLLMNWRGLLDLTVKIDAYDNSSSFTQQQQERKELNEILKVKGGAKKMDEKMMKYRWENFSQKMCESLKKIRKSKSKLRKFRLFVGGHDIRGLKESRKYDLRYLCLEMIEFFKKNLLLSLKSKEEQTTPKTGDHLEYFELGCYSCSAEPHSLGICKTLFIWKKEEGIWFECNHEEYKGDILKSYNDDCTIL